MLGTAGGRRGETPLRAGDLERCAFEGVVGADDVDVERAGQRLARALAGRRADRRAVVGLYLIRGERLGAFGEGLDHKSVVAGRGRVVDGQHLRILHRQVRKALEGLEVAAVSARKHIDIYPGRGRGAVIVVVREPRYGNGPAVVGGECLRLLGGRGGRYHPDVARQRVRRLRRIAVHGVARVVAGRGGGRRDLRWVIDVVPLHAPGRWRRAEPRRRRGCYRTDRNGGIVVDVRHSRRVIRREASRGCRRPQNAYYRNKLQSLHFLLDSLATWL